MIRKLRKLLEKAATHEEDWDESPVSDFLKSWFADNATEVLGLVDDCLEVGMEEDSWIVTIDVTVTEPAGEITDDVLDELAGSLQEGLDQDESGLSVLDWGFEEDVIYFVVGEEASES